MKKIKLFCIPYAGGSAVLFNKWRPYLDPLIELCPIELAGRGVRIHEPLYNNLAHAVEDVLQKIKNEIDQRHYALLGHSMGGLITYHLAHKIRELNFTPPLHTFFSGRSAPHVKRPDEEKFHLMEEELFKQSVFQLGGTLPEFFEHPELLQLFLPLLRNDFKIAETETTCEEIQPLEGSITVFLGKEDDYTAEQCDGWKKHTRQRCTIHYFEGGHFFLHQQTEQLVHSINKTLLEIFTDKVKHLELQ